MKIIHTVYPTSLSPQSHAGYTLVRLIKVRLSYSSFHCSIVVQIAQAPEPMHLETWGSIPYCMVQLTY